MIAAQCGPSIGQSRHHTPSCHRASCQRPVAARRHARLKTMAQAAAAQHGPSPRVVICGGGIIGAATAYYLATRMGVAATIVEQETIACAASGKAGGFLGLDWNDGSAVGPLSRASYALHKQLAQELGADTIGYRPVTTLQVTASAIPPKAARAAVARPSLPGWLDGQVSSSGVLGNGATTAQVHPAKLTRALVSAAEAKGARVVAGTVQGMQLTDDGKRVEGVVLDGNVMPADAVVVAMGPWSDLARQWLPLPPIGGQKVHSTVLRPKAGGEAIGADMLFTKYRLAGGRTIEPEVYPRPDGSVYVCGESSEDPLPARAADINVRENLCNVIEGVAGALASSLDGAEVEARQACYLPLSPDGLPLIGRVPGIQGAYVATGHSCWGILNGPATGLAMAELIMNGKAKTVDLSAFDPERLAMAAGKRRR